MKRIVCVLMLLCTLTGLTSASQCTLSSESSESGDTHAVVSDQYADSFDYPVKDDNPEDVLEWGVVQDFGALYAEMGGYHSGEDWNLLGGRDADLGKPVYAIANGEIKKVSPLGELGYLVAIEHQAAPGKTFIIPAKQGQLYSYPAEEVTIIYSVYIHLKIDTGTISEGAWIKKGFPIGTIINPGGGAHLHFEIRHQRTVHSGNWSMVGDNSNWAILNNKVTGYYLNLQEMVDAGLRDPSDFINANSTEAPTSTETTLPETGQAPSPVVIWTNEYPGNSYHPAYAVAVDSKDNVIVGGASLYANTYLLIKYSPDGEEIWRRLPNEGTKEVYAIAVDSNDNIVVTQAVATDVSEGWEEYFLIKLDAQGNEIWREAVGQSGRMVKIDRNNNIAVGGISIYQDEKYYYRYKSVIAKYDSEGNELWERTEHDGYHVTEAAITGIAVDWEGSIIAVGNDFVMKYDKNGTKLWEVSFDGKARDVTIDASGNVIVTGLGELQEAEGEGFATSGFLTIKCDQNGQLLWEKRYNSTRSAYGVAIDSGGNIIVVGGFGVVGSNYLIIMYDSNGNQLWEEKNANGYIAEAIAVDSRDNFIVTGSANLNEGWFTVKYSTR